MPFVPRDPIARARGSAQSCPTYKKRRQLSRPPQRINIVYVSMRVSSLRIRCLSLHSSQASVLPNQPAISADTNAARAVLHVRVELDKISSSPLCRQEESCQPFVSFLRTSDHLSKLPSDRPLLLFPPPPLHFSCPASHTRHLLGIRSVPVGQSCNPTGVIGFGLIHWSFVPLPPPHSHLCLLRSSFSLLYPSLRIGKLDPAIRAEQKTAILTRGPMGL